MKLRRALIGAITCTALVTSMGAASAEAADTDDPKRPTAQKTKSVPVAKVGADTGKKDAAVAAGRVPLATPSWPVPGKKAQVATSGTWSTNNPTGISLKTAGTTKQTASVEVLAAGKTSSGQRAPRYRIVPQSPAGTTGTPTARQIRIDYADFADAYGGGWASRLAVVDVTSCAGVEVAGCATATPLETTNNEAEQSLTAEMPRAMSARSSTLAVTSEPSGEEGDYTATSLNPAANWDAGGQSGDFHWTYPLPVPPGVNGPEPDLALTYSSGAVDGRTSGSNNQTSWVGEGFSLDPGFVERTYTQCSEDMTDTNATEKTGDQCWRDDNLTLSLDGRSSRLLKTSDSDVWKLKDDDGSRIERKRGVPNGDNDGEYWLLTSVDGTRYYFGRHQRFEAAASGEKTNSVSTVPVFGNQSGEPCHATAFKDSACNQAWRWGLDLVVDTNGNSMSLFYDQETNKYGKNKNKSVAEYDRAAVLKRIDYGQRAGEETTAAPARMVFTASERCLPDAEFDCGELNESTAKNWPDVPYDQICRSDTSCADRLAPTFFSRKRLTGITTQVLSGGTYSAVDTWSLDQSFPDPGDNTGRSLWLKSIARTGRVGTDVADAKTTFSGITMENRVDKIHDNSFAFNKWRVIAITNGAGGVTSVNYTPKDCTPGNVPDKDALKSNSRRCFPSYFTPRGAADPEIHFFHKYLTESIVESDQTGGSPAKLTSYVYSGAPAWALDESPSTRKKYRTYNDWRGYASVSTRTGGPSITQTNLERTYFRGLGGAVDGIPDRDHYNGFVRSERTTLGPGGATVEATFNWPWSSSDHAADSSGEARIVRVGTTEVHTPLASGGTRVAKTTTDYNEDGLPVEVNDSGELEIADNQCTRTTYAQNRDKWILDTPSRDRTTVGSCDVTVTSLSDVIADERTAYDGQAVGTAPTRGNATLDESINSTGGFTQNTSTTYDDYGRETRSSDAQGNASTTDYAPATGSPTTVTTINPMGHTTQTTLDVNRGQPTRIRNERGNITELTYDGLGRSSAVWLPGRSRSDGQSANSTFAYAIGGGSSASVVTTRTLNAAGDYVPTYTFYDGLLRERETQTLAAGAAGGRLVTEKVYDSYGRLADDRGPFYNTSAPSSTLITAADYETPLYSRYEYDLAGRVVVQAQKSMATEKWRTTTSYGGDRTNVDPPTGSTATTTVTDVRGRTTELLQYRGASPTGAADTTRYSYTPNGDLSSVTDASGVKWTNTYDIRGNMVRSNDPDRGATETTYDNLDRPVSTKDAAGRVLWTTFDRLGRKSSLRDNSATGTMRASWSYDTLGAGLPVGSTRYVRNGTDANGQPIYDTYTSEVTGYDTSERALGNKLVIPASEGLLSRSGGYVTTQTYNVDDSVNQTLLPTATGLVGERLSYTYDALGNVKTFTGAGSIVGDTVYSPYGEVLQRSMGPTVGKSVFESREYEEGTRRLTRRAVSRQGTATTMDLDLRYGRDAAGNITSLADLSGAAAAQDRQCFTYDYLRRMNAAWSTSSATCAAPTPATAPTNLGSVAPYWDTYTFDPTGNRTQWTQRVGAGSSMRTTTHAYTYPAATAARPHTLSKVTATGATAATETFGYDAVGNTTDRTKTSTTGQTITWDAEGRQTSVTDKATKKVTSYLYDAEGNRLIKRDGADTSVTLYAGVTEYKLKAGAVTALRNFAVDGEQVAVRIPGALKIVSGDSQGTGMVEIDGSSAAVTKRRMTPYGAPRVTATWTGDKGFLGKTTDASTGTTHLDAREYDPTLGRFLSLDPLVDPNDPQQMNGYAYGNNAPVTSSDPSGLRPVDDRGRPIKEDQQASNKAQVYITKTRYPSSSGGGSGGGSHSGGSRTPSRTPTPSAYTAPKPLGPTADALAKGIAMRNTGLFGKETRPITVLDAIRFMFDERQCDTILSIGCGGEVAMAVPFGKPLKPLKVGIKAAKAAKKSEKYVDLATPARRKHILEGDGPGRGGHQWPGQPGKSAFPRGWNGDKIMHEISDVATSPTSKFTQDGGGMVAEGTRDGVDIRVFMRHGEIVSGYPTNLGRNPL